MAQQSQDSVKNPTDYAASLTKIAAAATAQRVANPQSQPVPEDTPTVSQPPIIGR